MGSVDAIAGGQVMRQTSGRQQTVVAGEWKSVINLFLYFVAGGEAVQDESRST